MHAIRTTTLFINLSIYADAELKTRLTKVRWQCGHVESAQPGHHLQSSMQKLLSSVLNINNSTNMNAFYRPKTLQLNHMRAA